MKYLLALQFPCESTEDYDQIIAIENALCKYLRGIADVDGHDAGAGEMNVFIFTDEPAAAFERAKIIVKAAGMLAGLSAAHRLKGEEHFSRLWPSKAIKPFTIV